MRTAEVMFENKRYIHAIFMCHLSIEKALKGLYQKKTRELPPRIHNLVFLIEKMGLKPPSALYEDIFSLNRVSIPTRYPDDLEKMKKEFNKNKTAKFIKSGKEIIRWLKTQ